MADQGLAKPLTDRFSEAVSYACALHRTQERKGTQIPYASHLLGVASIALEFGATENEAIAALLHDAVEDQARGGETKKEILSRFGPDVLAIVEGCTDAEGEAGQEKPPWRRRKETYVAHVKTAPPSTKFVSACDKLHNARAIVSDAHQLGKAIWSRFTGGEDTPGYYRALVTAFRAGAKEEAARMRGLIDELDRTVTAMEALAGGRREDWRV
jgi:(p)ppGpp synthase/HD superfamily hydrolase